LEEKSEEDVGSRIQVQLDENRDDSTKQSWIKKCGLWPMFYGKWPRPNSSDSITASCLYLGLTVWTSNLTFRLLW